MIAMMTEMPQSRYANILANAGLGRNRVWTLVRSNQKREHLKIFAVDSSLTYHREIQILNGLKGRYAEPEILARG